MSPHREQSRDSAPLLRSTSRARLAILLSATGFGYASLNAFWLYLSTGGWFRLRPMQFVADFTSPVRLPDLFERTLNVLSHPSMIFVGGLVLGTLLMVPILVAVLHRLWAALALVAAVWVLGHAPVMALALGIGCWISSKTHLRRTAPFLAALLGALPMCLYLYLFSSAGSSSAAFLPMQRWALKAPYLAAVLVALGGFAVVLNLARASRYRPGLVWPLLAAFLSLPAGVFSWTVGRPELEYQFIAGPLAAGDALFEPMDLTTWTATVGGAGISPQAIPQRAAADLEDRKTELQDRCRRYLRRFPRSRRAPAVLWVWAQCQSLQLDRPALAQGWVKSTAGQVAPVPNEEGLSPVRRAELTREAIQSATSVWEAIPREYPRSPQAALANWRLAELDLRRLAARERGSGSGAGSGVGGASSRAAEDANVLVRRAEERLRTAQRGIRSALEDWDRRERAGRSEEVFGPAPSVPPHEYYEQALWNVHRLQWLMARNDALTNPRAAEAIGALLQVNGLGLTQQAQAQQLYDLAGKYEDTPMAMNLKLAVALTEAEGPRRMDLLQTLAEQDRDPDAAVEAAFQLAQMLLRRPAFRGLPGLKAPADYFRFVRDANGNPWKDLAAERLKFMEIAPKPAKKDTETEGTEAR